MVALRYGLLGVPVAVLGLPFYIYIPAYLAENLGYGYAVVGFVFLLARLSDVVTDIPVGACVDRWGHARGMMFLGVFLSAVCVCMVVLLPHPLSTLLLAVLVAMIFLSWTLITVPWLSLPVGLESTVAAQLRLNSSRELFLLLGTLLALTVPAFLPSELLLPALGVVGLVTVLCIAMMPLSGHSPARQSVPGFALLREPCVRQLALPWFINALANAIPGTVLLVFVREVLRDEAAAGPALGIYFLAAVCGLPLWYWLATRIGEVMVWKITMLLASMTFAGALLLGEGDTKIFWLICLLSGLTLGADQAMPASLQTHLARKLADRHGGDVGGRMLALWSLIQKAAMGLAVAMTFLWLGGNANVAGEVSPWVVSVAYVAFPVGLKVAALWVLSRKQTTEVFSF